MKNNGERKLNKQTGRNLSDERLPLDMSRRILAHKMMVSAMEIPHVCYEYEPDVTAFMEYFSALKKSGETRVTFNTLMLRCIAEGLKASPMLNSHLYYKHRSAKGTIRTFKQIDINMPTILPDGAMQSLLVRDAGAGTLGELDDKIKALVAKSKDPILFAKAQYDVAIEQTLHFLKQGKIFTVLSRLFGAYFGKERLQPVGCKNQLQFLAKYRKYRKTADLTNAIQKEDLREGTLVVSNVGSIKKDLTGRVSMFEIIPPQVFAVMVGALQRKPLVIKKENGEETVEIRTILAMNLAFDHRACDFGDLVPFIERLDEIFANPSIIKEWM